ncbi:hypothetical protein DVH05_002654 [Phytophthora capsici]|nr:hypothetical protein DVH05_004753 [Phytophthora capsici]KAG1706093.1 hypothetical protein DVH05_002654 [Phytophthora capsici]
MGKKVRTRASSARLNGQEDPNSPLREVMEQDAEDNEGEPSDNDSDYVEGDTESSTGCDTGSNIGGDTGVGTGSDTGPSKRNETGDTGRSRDGGLEEDNDDAEDSDESNIEKGDEVRSSEYESASDVSQKRHRKSNRKSPQKDSHKTARTETAVPPRDGGDDDDGAFLEGFPRRWATWEDFNEAFESFQAATSQNFSGRTSTSVLNRNKQMRVAVARDFSSTGDTSDAVGKRKGTHYIPKEWVKNCKTLRCTHGQSQGVRGSGQRKHRKVRSTACTAKVNARVIYGYSGWSIAVKASGHHNHPVTKHQWCNYAENKTITDKGLIHDASEMHNAGAHAKVSCLICENSRVGISVSMGFRCRSGVLT